MDELKEFEAKAAAIDQSADQPQNPETAIPVDKQSQLTSEFVIITGILLNALYPAFPSLKNIYTEQIVNALSDSTARVCIKHDWLPDGIRGKWGEELALAAIAVPLAVATNKAIKTDMAANKAKTVQSVEPDQS